MNQTNPQLRGIDLKTLLRIVRYWWWIFLSCICLGGIVGYWLSLQSPATYKSSILLLIEDTYSPVQSFAVPDVLSGERANTYLGLLRLDLTIEYLVTDLQMDREMLETWLLDVHPVRLNNSQLYEITVLGQNPKVAFDVANLLPTILNGQLNALRIQRFSESRASLQAQMDLLEQQIATVEASINIDSSTEQNELPANLVQYQNTYANLLQSYENLRLVELQTLDQINVMRSARFPTAPQPRNIILNTLFGIGIGIALASAIVLLIEYADDKIRSPESLQQVLDTTFLGAVPTIPQQHEENGRFDSQLITANNPRHPISEAYRIIRTNLQFSNIDAANDTLLITSPGPSGGKSTTVANLAITMAQTSRSVLVVDADLRKPTQHHLFELQYAKGLSDALLNPTDCPLQYTYPVGVPNLHLMPSGVIPPNPAELLGSQRMQELILQLEKHFDVVIFDTPPLLAVSDSAILANRIKNTILVVNAKRTTQSSLMQATSALDKVNGCLLGIIMNEFHRTSGYYYPYLSPKTGPRARVITAITELAFGGIFSVFRGRPPSNSPHRGEPDFPPVGGTEGGDVPQLLEKILLEDNLMTKR